MKVLVGFPIWLLASFVRSEDNVADNLHLFDGMDATLGLIERNFGESITKKLSFALFEGTQSSRSPLEILSKFMQELTPEETNSISKGIASSIIELAEVLKQPGTQEQLMLFISTAPSLFTTLSTLTGGGGIGYSTGGDKKGKVPVAKWNADDDDPFEARKGKKKKSILDYEPADIEENNGEEIIELAGDLLKTGASLLGSIGSTVAKGSGKPGGGLMGFATKIVERMIEEGILDEDFMENIDADADLEDDEVNSGAADDQPVGKEKNEIPPSSKPTKPQSKSTKDPKNDEKEHLEL